MYVLNHCLTVGGNDSAVYTDNRPTSTDPYKEIKKAYIDSERQVMRALLRLPHPFNLCPDSSKFFNDVFIAAIKVIDAVDDRFTISHKPREHHGNRGT